MPARKCIMIESNNKKQKIPWRPDTRIQNCHDPVQIGILRSDSNCTVFPGDFLKVKAPPSIALLGDARIFISPRNSKARMTFIDQNNTKFENTLFPLPKISHVINGDIFLPNSSTFPVIVSKNDQLADIRIMSSSPEVSNDILNLSVTEQFYARPKPSVPVCQVEKIQLDPDNILSQEKKKLLSNSSPSRSIDFTFPR